MKKSLLYSISLIASIILIVIAAISKIQHRDGTSFLYSLGMIIGLPFIYLGIKDSFENKKREPMVKLMWTIGFIFLSVITGLVYHEQFRKRNIG